MILITLLVCLCLISNTDVSNDNLNTKEMDLPLISPTPTIIVKSVPTIVPQNETKLNEYDTVTSSTRDVDQFYPPYKAVDETIESVKSEEPVKPDNIKQENTEILKQKESTVEPNPTTINQEKLVEKHENTTPKPFEINNEKIKPVEPVNQNEDEFTIDSSSDNNTMKSSLIIFQDDLKAIIPSLEEDYEEAKANRSSIWFHNNDFIPQNIDDFIKASPDYSYDENQILKPGNNGINRNLGEDIFMKAYNFYINNALKSAKSLFLKLIFYNYRISDSSYYLSWCFYLEKDFPNAVRYMIFAVKQGELSGAAKERIAEYAYQAGSFYIDMNEYQNAIIYLEKAVQIFPLLYKSYNQLGIAYYQSGKLNEALQAWRKGKEGNDQNCQKNYDWLIGIIDEKKKK